MQFEKRFIALIFIFKDCSCQLSIRDLEVANLNLVELESEPPDLKSECVRYLNCNLSDSKSESRDSNLRGHDFEGAKSELT